MSKQEKNKVGDTPPVLHNAAAPGWVQRVLDTDAPATKALLAQRGALPNMDRFFGTKERTFWTLQCSGWLGHALLRLLNGIAAGDPILETGFYHFGAAFIGFCISLAMRYLFREIKEIRISYLIGSTILLCAFLGLPFSALELEWRTFLGIGQPFVGMDRFINAPFESMALFAWSAIYFGYHLNQSMLDQKEQVLKATAMAHQAQLKMLRYQLNPHFLFNTLNAISTLVLEKSEKDANRMLTKLSSFLRYTLVNEPSTRVTLEQEIQTLNLYLDIEKVRFQDRLVLEFDIQEKAKDALIPSLILQPLIENAIKYAVAPSMTGGTIRVSADVVASRLVLMVSDTGPGIEDLTNIVSKTSSGVGVANTRERLSQLYGAEHTIKIHNLEPSGLCVRIEIPCERKKPA